MTPLKKLPIYSYIHVIPDKLFLFMKYWVVHPEEWYRIEIGSEISSQLGLESSFKDAVISYVSIIIIAAFLLTMSYFLLKRRYERT